MKSVIWILIAIVLLSQTGLASDDWLNAANDSTPAQRTDMISRFALTFGTPAGLNFNYSFWAPSRLTVRLTAGVIPGAQDNSAAGIQGEIGYALIERRKSVIDFSIGGGTSQVTVDHRQYSWSYGGLFGTVNSGGLFFQLGITAGAGDYSSPQVSLQLGFNLLTIHRH